MDSLLDNLRILAYQQKFIPIFNLQPLAKTYFLFPDKNPNEQFYYLASLSYWFSKLLNKSFEQPKQFDDPNATVSNILNAAKSAGLSIDIGPQKLKTGSGDDVVQFLTMYSEIVLKTVLKFKFEKPTHKTEDFADEAEVDADAEVKTDTLINDPFPVDEHNDDEDFMFVPETNKTANAAPTVVIVNEKQQIDPVEWKLEVERVTPLLKVSIQNDNKDWRVHVDQISTHHGAIEKLLVNARGDLEGVYGEIEKSLEKIGSRERYINTQFESQCEEYKSLQDQMSALKLKHQVANSNVTELTNNLAKISDDLEHVKARIDDIGNGMTDSKPLTNIKQGVVRLKAELKQMDLRMGVIQHTLLSSKMKSRGGMMAGDRPIVESY